MRTISSHPFVAGYSLQIEERYGQYFVGIARTGTTSNYCIMSDKRSNPFATEQAARAEANRLWPLLRDGGVAAFAPRPTLIREDDLAWLHPRQQVVLALIPRRHRRVVLSRAHLLVNLTGGILSDALYRVAQEYRSLVGHRGAPSAALELERRSRADNHAAMASCGAKGCSACARDAQRAGVR